MDFKEYLLMMAEVLGSARLKEIAEGMKDNAVALPDDLAAEVREQVDESMGNFLSLEAAQNNPKLEKHFKTKLFPTLKGEILGNIDTEIDGIAASVFSTEVAQEILAEENTKNKLKIFNEKSKELLKKRMPNDESRQKLEELTKKYNDAQTEWAQKIAAKEQEVEQEKQKVHDTLIRSKVTEMAKGYKWRESLAEETVQPVLIDKIYQKLKTQAAFKYNEAGEIEVFDRDNPGTVLFQNNKKIGLKDLLDKEIDPYLDKAPAKKVTQYQPSKQTSSDETPMRRAIKAGAAEFVNKSY